MPGTTLSFTKPAGNAELKVLISLLPWSIDITTGFGMCVDLNEVSGLKVIFSFPPFWFDLVMFSNIRLFGYIQLRLASSGINMPDDG